MLHISVCLCCVFVRVCYANANVICSICSFHVYLSYLCVCVCGCDCFLIKSTLGFYLISRWDFYLCSNPLLLIEQKTSVRIELLVSTNTGAKMLSKHICRNPSNAFANILAAAKKQQIPWTKHNHKYLNIAVFKQFFA